MPVHQRKVTAIIAKLLEWFLDNARDLPWRCREAARDPYAIWVSEIMLQQTQVKTVIPYWERWMRALPTIRALADAKTDTIHKLWEGLGYYTRVRNMQKAARQIIAIHDGKIPADFVDILELPGVGRYTAGAIASIAFNQPQPILDGNVIRVLTRLFGIGGNPRAQPVNEKLWQLAGDLVSAARPHCSQLNQSLMELGATVCTPRNPKCGLCPVRKNCVAWRTGRVEELPNLGPRPVATIRCYAAFVVVARGRFLVRQRPSGVVNAHLWEFPNVELAANGLNLEKIARDELGIAVTGLRKLCVVKHSITRYRNKLEAFLVKTKSAPITTSSLPGSRWLNLAKLNTLAFTGAHRRILEQGMANCGKSFAKIM